MTGRLDGTLSERPVTIHASGQTLTIDAPLSWRAISDFRRMRRMIRLPEGELGLDVIFRVKGYQVRRLSI